MKERVEQGLAIIGPYNNVWTSRLFDTPADAIAYLKNFWGKSAPIDWPQWKVAPATLRIEVDHVVMFADPIPLNPEAQ